MGEKSREGRGASRRIPGAARDGTFDLHDLPPLPTLEESGRVFEQGPLLAHEGHAASARVYFSSFFF